jgi:uncharacterized protein YaiE (UPF0345 family)
VCLSVCGCPSLGAPIGPKITEAEETQRYQLSASGGSLLVQAEAIYPSVPYGECFKVTPHSEQHLFLWAAIMYLCDWG